MFAQTAMYGRGTPLYEREAVAIKILNASNHFWNTFTWTACIVLNYVMANDFVLSLIRPMEKHQVRLNVRLVLLLSGCFISSMAFALSVEENDSYIQEVSVVAYLFILYILVALSSLFFGFALVRSYGLGKKTKSQIFWRHTVLLIVYLICNIYLIIALFLPRADDPSTLDLVNEWPIKVS